MAKQKECFCHQCRIGVRADGTPIGSFIDYRTHKEHALRTKRARSQSPSHPTGSKRPAEELEKENAKKQRKEGSAIGDPDEVVGEGIFADIRMEIALAVKGFQNPTILLFGEADETTMSVPDVITTSYHPDTNAFLEHLLHMEGVKTRILQIDLSEEQSVRDRRDLLDLIDGELQRLRDMKLQLWNLSQSSKSIKGLMGGQSANRISVCDTNRYFQRRQLGHDLTTACLISVLLLNLFGGLSRDQSSFLLEGLHIILSLSFSIAGVATELKTQDGEPAGLEAQQILAGLPKSLSGAFAKFDIDPELTKLACCTTCCATYEPEIGKDGRALYPEYCTHKETKSSEPCGTQLVIKTGFKEATCLKCKAKHLPSRNQEQEFGYPTHCTNVTSGQLCRGKLRIPADQDWNTPIRIFCFLRFLEHIGRWFSLPSTEDAIEHYSRLCMLGDESSWRSSLQADYIRNFCGADGRRFLEPTGTDLHLIFTLFVDWFNPFLNKAAGKRASIGAIYMTCLNLPPHLRYKDENMYLVGLIPGPEEPHVHEINHFLRHVVDDLLALWHGVFLTKTFKHPHGRIIRVALIPLVADVPAIRKTAGYVGHNATLFCSLCQLERNEKSNFNRRSWPRRTAEQHRYVAECWKNAENTDIRDAITDSYGIRWSELLRLKYWDPVKFRVVDSMHNLLLGLIRTHCIDIWMMNIKSGEKEKVLKVHSATEQSSFLAKTKAIIEGAPSGITSALGRIRKGYIVRICETNGILPEDGKDTKAAFVNGILEWRKSNRTVVLPMNPAGGDPTLDGTSNAKIHSVLGTSVLQEMHKDMANTLLPHWLESPPRDLGSKSHGKLKADHWRTVCTVTLVITLVRLWGFNANQYEMLENLLDLSRAVRFATARSTSLQRIRDYEGYISAYLDGMVCLYGEEFVPPNHHLALHLIEVLLGFGPVHSWWSFPYERLNGRLQRIRTNRLMRTIPATYMMHFLRGVNLLMYITNSTRPIIQKFNGLVLKWLKNSTDSREEGKIQRVLRAFGIQDKILLGMDFSDELLLFDNSNVSALSPEDYQKLVLAVRAVQGPNANFVHQENVIEGGEAVANLVDHRKELKMRQVFYRTASFSRREKQKNCSVEFMMGTGAHAVGKIVDIFVHQRTGATEAFFKIRRNQELQGRDVELDPYRRFKDIGAKLYYEDFDSYEIVPAKHVLAHIAVCPYNSAQSSSALSKPSFVAISLSRD